jgi:hypothetical protein
MLQSIPPPPPPPMVIVEDAWLPLPPALLGVTLTVPVVLAKVIGPQTLLDELQPDVLDAPPELLHA